MWASRSEPQRACGAAGRPREGLALEDEAIQIAESSEGQTLASEFIQRRGDLRLAADPEAEAEAEAEAVQADMAVLTCRWLGAFFEERAVRLRSLTGLRGRL